MIIISTSLDDEKRQKWGLMLQLFIESNPEFEADLRKVAYYKEKGEIIEFEIAGLRAAISHLYGQGKIDELNAIEMRVVAKIDIQKYPLSGNYRAIVHFSSYDKRGLKRMDCSMLKSALGFAKHQREKQSLSIVFDKDGNVYHAYQRTQAGAF